MSTPAAIRFIDIIGAIVGTTHVSSITSVSYSQKTKRISGGSDGDKVETFQMKGMNRVSGMITMQDVVQANALLALASGDFVFTGTPSTGSTVLTVTIKGCTFFDDEADAKHDDLHGARVSFSGFNPTGAANSLVTVANA